MKENPFSTPLDIRHILSNSPPPQDHVLPGLLAGTVGMLAGPGGVGKTMFELQIALAIASGSSICGGLFDDAEVANLISKQPGKVVLVVAEESVDVIWNRLHAIVSTVYGKASTSGLNIDMNALMNLFVKNLHIHALAGISRVTLMNQQLMPAESFNQLTAACAGARLVILDPIRRFHISEENDSGAMTALVQMLQELSSTTNAAVVFAHHTNRASTQQGQGDTAGAARGSTALTDGVRWQLNMSNLTKEAARNHGIAEYNIGQFVMLNITKANYLSAQIATMLQRQNGGVLLCAAVENRFTIKTVGKNSGTRAQSQFKVISS